MLTDVVGDLESQRRWFSLIQSDPSVRYWMILWNERPIGVINLADINFFHRRTTAGYYIGELDYRQLGAVVPPYLYNYVFQQMKLGKIFGEVVSTNTAVLRMHRSHGYREVGTLLRHVIKHGSALDIVLVELMAETWLSQPKYARYVAEFE
jgi:hypothetical protein